MRSKADLPFTFGLAFEDLDLSITDESGVSVLMAEEQAMGLVAWHDRGTCLRRDMIDFLAVFTPNLALEDDGVSLLIRQTSQYVINRLKHFDLLQMTGGSGLLPTEAFSTMIELLRRRPRDPVTGRMLIVNPDMIMTSAPDITPFQEPLLQPHRDFGYLLFDRSRGYLKPDLADEDRYVQFDPVMLQSVFNTWIQGPAATKTSLTALVKDMGFAGRWVPTDLSRMVLDRYLLTGVAVPSARTSSAKREPVIFEPTAKGEASLSSVRHSLSEDPAP